MNPVFNPHSLFGFRFTQALCRVGNHLLFGGGKRSRFRCKAFNRRIIPIRRNQRRQCFNQVPGGAVHARLVAGMNVTPRPASPLLAAGSQLHLDYSLSAQVNHHLPIQPLRSAWHKNAFTFLQRCQHLRPPHNLRKVWRANLFLSFRHQHQVYRKLASRPANGMQCSQERPFRPFLIHGAAADDDLPKAGLVHQCGIPGRRRPL